MKEKINDFSARNAIRVTFLLAALGGFSVAHAEMYSITQSLENAASFQRFVSMSTGGVKTIPYSAAPTLAKYEAGVLMSGSGQLTKGLVINVATRIPAADIALGATRLLGGPLGLGLLLGTPLLLDWIVKNQLTPNYGDNSFSVPISKDGYEYSLDNETWSPSATQACSLAADKNNSMGYIGYSYSLVSVVSNTPGSATCKFKSTQDGISTEQQASPLSRPVSSAEMKRIPISDLPKYVITVPDPAIIPEILEKGGKIQPATTPWTVTVTGPAKTTGETTTTTNPDGSTTKKTASTTNTYSGPTVTTSQTDTTTATSPDGAASSTTTTTSTDAAELPETDLCKLNPDILACAKPDLDTPDGTIPKVDKNVTFTPENPFGEGSCPANLTAELRTLGQSVTVWDWQKTCDYSIGLRALVIGLATFAAFLIVMPGETRV